MVFQYWVRTGIMEPNAKNAKLLQKKHKIILSASNKLIDNLIENVENKLKLFKIEYPYVTFVLGYI